MEDVEKVGEDSVWNEVLRNERINRELFIAIDSICADGRHRPNAPLTPLRPPCRSSFSRTSSL